jgi:hypothetical protein
MKWRRHSSPTAVLKRGPHKDNGVSPREPRKENGASRQINLRLSTEMLEAVEKARGDIPRERWIRGVIDSALREAG